MYLIKDSTLNNTNNRGKKRSSNKNFVKEDPYKPTMICTTASLVFYKSKISEL